MADQENRQEVKARAAKEEDIDRLADLLNMANYGLIEDEFTRLAKDGETWRDLVRKEFLNKASDLYLGGCMVAEVDGQVAGMMLINVEPSEWIEPNYDELSPSTRPIVELRSYIPGHVFIRDFAVDPSFRNSRIGTLLIDAVFDSVWKHQYPAISATVHESNELCLICVKRAQMKLVATRKVIQHTHYAPGTEWHLYSVENPELRAAKDSAD